MQNCTDVDQALRTRLGLEGPAFVAGLLPQLVDLVRSSRRLPLGEEHAIRRSSKDFLAASKELGQRTLNAVHRTLCYLDPPAHSGMAPEELVNFNLIIDSIDSVLERVDASLRDAMAEPRDGAAAAAEAEGVPEPGVPRTTSGSFGSRGSVPKPQVRWRHLIDNQRTLFVPRLLIKHNQQVPLPSEVLEAQQLAGFRMGGPQVSTPIAEAEEPPAALQQHLHALGVGRRQEHRALPHPYDHELAALTWPDSYFQVRPAERYVRMEDTPLVFVRTEQALREMIEEIKATCQGKEIAVDVEHHDYRSYRGFVCLVQVSTRQKDFIIDPFDIFPQMHMLNEIFTDPGIVKVLHGADRDVIWLQRDFSVYLVNMFDTGLATRVLRLQGGFSLANLVSLVCGVKLDKKYQTADWRERPLSDEMLQYARSDTHYLLYCYDCLKNALLGQTAGVRPNVAACTDDLKATDEGVHALQSVLDSSRNLCLTRYAEGPLDAANDAMRVIERFGSKTRPLDSRQFNALRALIDWRDRLARNLDESWNFISPDACLYRIALAMPSTPAQLRSSCNPLPATVQQYAQEVLELVATSTDSNAQPGPAAGEQPAVASGNNSGAPPAGVATGNSAAVPSAPPAATKAAQQVEAPRRAWPLRILGVPRPVVHVSAARRASGSAGLSQILGALCESDDSGDEAAAPRPTVDRVEAIRRAIRFATAAPTVPAAVEALLAAAEAEAAAVAEMDLTAEASHEATLAQQAADAAAACGADIVAPLGKRRRKRRHTNDDNLEIMAKAAVDPYTPPAVTDPYAAAEAQPPVAAAAAAATAEAEPEVAAAEGPKKKKKKKASKTAQVDTSGNILIDPYL